MKNILHFKYSSTFYPNDRSLLTKYVECQRLYSTTKLPRGHWLDKENQKAFFDQLAIKWKIQKPEDWNKITAQMIKKEGGSFIDTYYNNSVRKGKYLKVDLLGKTVEIIL
jgi:hypothetical protein